MKNLHCGSLLCCCWLLVRRISSGLKRPILHFFQVLSSASKTFRLTDKLIAYFPTSYQCRATFVLPSCCGWCVARAESLPLWVIWPIAIPDNKSLWRWPDDKFPNWLDKVWIKAETLEPIEIERVKHEKSYLSGRPLRQAPLSWQIWPLQEQALSL